MERPERYSPEVRERAVRMVDSGERDVSRGTTSAQAHVRDLRAPPKRQPVTSARLARREGTRHRGNRTEARRHIDGPQRSNAGRVDT